MLGCLSACSSPTATKGSCFESLVSAAAPASPQVIWQNLGTPLFDGSGISDVVTVPFPSGSSDALFRVSSSSGPSVSRSTKPKTEAAARGFLHLFRAVTTEIIVSPVRRVSVGVQSALYLLPSGNRCHRVRPSLAFGWRCAIARRFFRPVPLLCPCLSKEKGIHPAPQNDLQPGQIPIQFIVGSGSIYHDQAAVFPDTLAAAVDVANTLFAGGICALCPSGFGGLRGRSADCAAR